MDKTPSTYIDNYGSLRIKVDKDFWLLEQYIYSDIQNGVDHCDEALRYTYSLPEDCFCGNQFSVEYKKSYVRIEDLYDENDCVDVPSEYFQEAIRAWKASLSEGHQLRVGGPRR